MPMKRVRIALCQITPVLDKQANVRHAFAMIEEAARNGAEIISLPEIFYYPYELPAIRTIAGDEDLILSGFRDLARSGSVYLCTGSMACSREGKIYNTSHLIGPGGDILLTYRKCHLFDVRFEKLHARESLVFSPGNSLASAATGYGTIGLLICYDIRFPEMARHLALLGTELLLVPAVFNQVTGPAHWECTMRARAIENQLYLAAISQGTSPDPKIGYKAYGHSMVVSPWGEVLAEAGTEETIIYADLDPELLDNVRKKLPLLLHRRGKLYTSICDSGLPGVMDL